MGRYCSNEKRRNYQQNILSQKHSSPTDIRLSPCCRNSGNITPCIYKVCLNTWDVGRGGFIIDSIVHRSNTFYLRCCSLLLTLTWKIHIRVVLQFSGQTYTVLLLFLQRIKLYKLSTYITKRRYFTNIILVQTSSITQFHLLLFYQLSAVCRSPRPRYVSPILAVIHCQSSGRIYQGSTERPRLSVTTPQANTLLFNHRFIDRSST